VGSLQELYGTNNGYPQAVIVAKKSLLTSNSQLVSDFLNAVVANSTWLTAETTSTQTIVSAISNHLPSGTTASLNAKNLTKTVIQNCGINFVDAQTDKSRITTYISSLQQINDTAVGQMADDFFYTAPQTLQSASNTTVSVYMPDGAPALSLAQLMAEEMQFGATVSYHVVTSESIASTVTGNNPQADICVLPSNLASKLLGTGATYQLLGTVTNGNLFILSKSEETITRSNLSVLQGKTVGVVNLAAVPGLTFKLILKNNNLTYADLNA
jgi:ABC-type nitrate/sulfonate/bicarbonate transport system substrate-binding protein